MKKIIFLIITILLISCSPEETTNVGESISGVNPVPTPGEIQTLPDGTKYLVHPDKIRGGGPPKGGIGIDRGIPALTTSNMEFISVKQADEWIEDNELVLALIHKNTKRVYPLQIMVFHEIANDIIEGDNILITYCPLCGSGIAYEPFVEVRGTRQHSAFGTSGKLYNSNLIMYDKLTDTYWQQIDGKAILGELTGQELKEISIDTVTWGEWKAAHPDSEVLSQDTGMSRPYGRDPYGNYYEDSYLIFPVDEEDNRIHPKTVIFGIEVDGVYKAYREEDVKKGDIKDVVAGVELTIERDRAGIVTITDEEGNEYVKERDFWFAWYAFHPDTLIYGIE